MSLNIEIVILLNLNLLAFILFKYIWIIQIFKWRKRSLIILFEIFIRYGKIINQFSKNESLYIYYRYLLAIFALLADCALTRQPTNRSTRMYILCFLRIKIIWNLIAYSYSTYYLFIFRLTIDITYPFFIFTTILIFWLIIMCIQQVVKILVL